MHDVQMHDRVDRLIAYLVGAWDAVPQYAEWWHDLDASQQEVIHLEWVGITEARLKELVELAARGCLTPEQQQQFKQLKSIEAVQRPVIERLLQT